MFKLTNLLVASTLLVFSGGCTPTETYEVNTCDHNGRQKVGKIDNTYGVIWRKAIQSDVISETASDNGETRYFIMLFDDQADLSNEKNLLPQNYLACNLPDRFKLNYKHIEVKADVYEQTPQEKELNIVPISITYIIDGPDCSE